MSSSGPLETNREATSAAALLRSNWIEIVAVPVASAIMETQPVAIALLFVIPRVFGSDNYPDPVSITFVLLFLHWWSMGTRYVFERRGASPGLFTFYDILGVVVALVLLLVTHLALLDDPTFSFIALILVGWGWKRGVDRARAGLNEEQLINAFKIGFTTLLVLMAFALISLVATSHDLADAQLRDLPIFFLTGLITLSFARIGIVQQEQARHATGKRRETMSNWLAALTFTWVVLVVVSIALEALPLQTIMELLGPLWYVVGLIASLIAYALDFIVTIMIDLFALATILVLSLLHIQNAHPRPASPPTEQVIHATQDSGTAMFALRLAVVALVIIIAIVVTRFLQKRRQGEGDAALDEEEEVREGLDINQVLRQRREERRQRSQASPLATLEQDSVRARYRAFLVAMSARGEEFTRHPGETPAEYERRVLDAARNIPPTSDGTTPADSTILNTLTRAYSLERYGERQASDEQQSLLRRWLPHLVQRLSEHFTSKPTISEAKRTSIQRTIQSRWGED